MIIFSPRSNNSLFPAMWMLKMAEETRIFWILFRPPGILSSKWAMNLNRDLKRHNRPDKELYWPTTSAREAGRLPPEHYLCPLSSNLILSPSQSALQQSTCYGSPSLASLPPVSSGSHTSFAPTFPRPLLLLSQPPTPGGIPQESTRQAWWRSKQVRGAGRWASDLHFPSTPPNPIPKYHPKLCSRLPMWPLLILCSVYQGLSRTLL